MGINGVWLFVPATDAVEMLCGDGSGALLASITQLTPVAKAGIFNTALPAIDTDWLGTDIAPTTSPSHLAIYVCVATAGIFSIARTNGGVTVTEQLNEGVALVANTAYGFKVSWLTGDTINFRYSTTGANILRLIANEEIA